MASISRYTRVLAFYAGQVWGDYQSPFYDPFRPFVGEHLPDGAYIYLENSFAAFNWFRSDYTPVVLKDVPKEYILLELLLR